MLSSRRKLKGVRPMTDEEALKEIDRQEKRLAAAKRTAEELVAAAEKAEAEGRMKIAEAKKLRSWAVQVA